jgi:hypothetical protein
MMRDLGSAVEKYRNYLYDSGLSGKRTGRTAKHLIDFLDVARTFTEGAIRSNRRSDGM